MPLRYRIVGFTAADAADPSKLLASVASSHPANPAVNHRQWKEAVEHLASIGALSLLVQEGVRDPDFLEEHEAFYSKQHRAISRHCTRVHAFKKSVPAAGPTSDTTAVLGYIDEAAAEPDSYLGFITIRPLRHAPVGATILVDRPEAPALCKDSFPVHIAGTTFVVSGTPYLQQDNAVGACAQASMWMALRTLRRRSGNSAYSPAELTLSATRYLALDRVFPGRRGLTVEQMLSAIKASNHDPLVIPITQPADPADVILQASPYIESGLPVVAILNHPTTGGHAVLAIGLAPNLADKSAPPPGLIIHNDNRGPYRILPQTVATGSSEYSLGQTGSLIIPVPDGIFMSAGEAEPQAISNLGFWLSTFLATPVAAGANLPVASLAARTYLCTRHAFRKWAKECPTLDASAKEIYRTTEMPKLVWVTEVHDAAIYEPANPHKQSRLGEIVLDASADSFHGDTLVFLRLTKAMLSVPTTSEGLLAIEGGGVLALGSSELTKGIAEPWL
jgi:hypothetical protein